MRLSTRTRAMFAMATAVSMLGAVAWAQNLEVKGNAWFATGGSGSAGIGTNAPLGKLHVIGSGGLGAENPDGTSQAGGVPIIAQSDGAAVGILNASGRQVFAINVEGNAGTTSARGYLRFRDNYDGVWRDSLFLYQGNAGIGVAPGAGYRLDVAGNVHVSGGVSAGYAAAPPTGGAIINGSVGIGTSYPGYKLDVNGAIAAGSSELYFTNAQHVATSIGATSGFAAIENVAAGYLTDATLKIQGRSGTAFGRRVDVHDYLQVNGLAGAANALVVNGNTTVTGSLTANGIRSTSGRLIYSSSCVGGNILTLDATCSICTKSGCTYGTNVVQGRLVGN